jgi:hypothetical protein
MERVQNYFPGCSDAFVAAVEASKTAYDNDHIGKQKNVSITENFLYKYAIDPKNGVDFIIGNEFWAILRFLQNLQRGRQQEYSKMLFYVDRAFIHHVRRSVGEINKMIVDWTMAVPDIASPRWMTHRNSPLVQLAQKLGVEPHEVCSKLIFPMIWFYYDEMRTVHTPEDERNYFLPPNYEDDLLKVIEVLLTHMQTPYRYLHIGLFALHYANMITKDFYDIGARLIALVTEKFNHLMKFRSFTAWFVVDTLEAIRNRLEHGGISEDVRQQLRRTAIDLKVWAFQTARQQPDIVKGNHNTPEAQAMLPLIEQSRKERQAIEHAVPVEPDPFAMEPID